MTKFSYIAKIILGFLITLLIMMSMQYYTLKLSEREYNDKIRDTLFQKKESLESILSILYKKAKKKGESQTEKIEKDINKIYQNNTKKLNSDLEKFINGDVEYTPLINIIESHTKDVYFNVQNDNNDSFIASIILENNIQKVCINNDYSKNCISFGRNRTEDEEKKMHFNPTLAVEALHDGVLKNKKYSFWNFLEVPEYYPWRKDILNLKTTDIDRLFYLFKKYNYNLMFFKSFEFLTFTEMKEYEDLAGNEININGKFNKSSKQLFYIMPFNLYDQIAVNKEYSNLMENYDKQIENYVKKLKDKQQMTALIISVETLVMILFTLLITSLPNYHLYKFNQD